MGIGFKYTIMDVMEGELIRGDDHNEIKIEVTKRKGVLSECIGKNISGGSLILTAEEALYLIWKNHLKLIPEIKYGDLLSKVGDYYLYCEIYRELRETFKWQIKITEYNFKPIYLIFKTKKDYHANSKNSDSQNPYRIFIPQSNPEEFRCDNFLEIYNIYKSPLTWGF